MSTDISETAQIIQLFASRPKRRGEDKTTRASSFSSNPQCEEGVSETGRNHRLRQQRHVAWRQADAVMDYWHASMKMDSAIFRVQNHGLPEGELHPEFNPRDHWRLLAKYREAFVRLMLTPAPDMLSVTWKRAQLKAKSISIPT